MYSFYVLDQHRKYLNNYTKKLIDIIIVILKVLLVSTLWPVRSYSFIALIFVLSDAMAVDAWCTGQARGRQRVNKLIAWE